ncbi:Transferase [Macleaya cordata]|uniref:Transferase n=1 Tax=Macleaya cordata TaxID=56857 RepID=A0A200Q3A5_MACCD|nr:Transferase [Macleaya cordata]
MAIGLINNTILKPSCSSSSSDEQSVILVPLTIFDKATFDLHVAVLYTFKPPMPSNEVMKEALSKVFDHYPHLAGRFTTDNQGRTCILLNNAGIRVTETYVPTTMTEQLPFDPSKDVSHLLPPTEGVVELFQVQLNRYACTVDLLSVIRLITVSPMANPRALSLLRGLGLYVGST